MSIDVAFNNLTEILEQEITLYRTMLETVRREHEILIAAKMDELIDNNKAKDAIISKIRAVDRIRDKRAKEFALVINYRTEPVRLLEMASHVEQPKGDRLRANHTTLDLLIRRIKEHNEKNEGLIETALRSISGALEDLKTSLEQKTTYEKTDVQKGQIPPGRFVSREA